MPTGTTNVGRGGGLATPIFNHDPGSALYNTIQELFTRTANATGFRWAKSVVVASGGTFNFLHDFDLPLALLKVQIYVDGTDAELTTANYTYVATVGNLRNSLTFTNADATARTINVQVSPLVALSVTNVNIADAQTVSLDNAGAALNITPTSQFITLTGGSLNSTETIIQSSIATGGTNPPNQSNTFSGMGSIRYNFVSPIEITGIRASISRGTSPSTLSVRCVAIEVSTRRIIAVSNNLVSVSATTATDAAFTFGRILVTGQVQFEFYARSNTGSSAAIRCFGATGAPGGTNPSYYYQAQANGQHPADIDPSTFTLDSTIIPFFAYSEVTASTSSTSKISSFVAPAVGKSQYLYVMNDGNHVVCLGDNATNGITNGIDFAVNDVGGTEAVQAYAAIQPGELAILVCDPTTAQTWRVVTISKYRTATIGTVSTRISESITTSGFRMRGTGVSLQVDGSLIVNGDIWAVGGGALNVSTSTSIHGVFQVLGKIDTTNPITCSISTFYTQRIRATSELLIQSNLASYLTDGDAPIVIAGDFIYGTRTFSTPYLFHGTLTWPHVRIGGRLGMATLQTSATQQMLVTLTAASSQSGSGVNKSFSVGELSNVRLQTPVVSSAAVGGYTFECADIVNRSTVEINNTLNSGTSPTLNFSGMIDNSTVFAFGTNELGNGGVRNFRGPVLTGNIRSDGASSATGTGRPGGAQTFWSSVDNTNSQSNGGGGITGAGTGGAITCYGAMRLCQFQTGGGNINSGATGSAAAGTGGAFTSHGPTSGMSVNTNGGSNSSTGTGANGGTAGRIAMIGPGATFTGLGFSLTANGGNTTSVNGSGGSSQSHLIGTIRGTGDAGGGGGINMTGGAANAGSGTGVGGAVSAFLTDVSCQQDTTSINLTGGAATGTGGGGSVQFRCASAVQTRQGAFVNITLAGGASTSGLGGGITMLFGTLKCQTVSITHGSSGGGVVGLPSRIQGEELTCQGSLTMRGSAHPTTNGLPNGLQLHKLRVVGTFFYEHGTGAGAAPAQDNASTFAGLVQVQQQATISNFTAQNTASLRLGAQAVDNDMTVLRVRTFTTKTAALWDGTQEQTITVGSGPGQTQNTQYVFNPAATAGARWAYSGSREYLDFLAPAMPAAGVVVNTHSKVLPAGTWMVTGGASVFAGTASVVAGADNYFVVSISTTSATEDTLARTAATLPTANNDGQRGETATNVLILTAPTTVYSTIRHNYTTLGNAGITQDFGSRPVAVRIA